MAVKAPAEAAGSQSELPGISTPSEIFRRLYYHLYSNSRATRAERIIEDLSLLLLTKLALEKGVDRRGLVRFLDGSVSADEGILPILRSTYPEIVDNRSHFSIGDDGVRLALGELDGLSLTTAPAHVVGDAFQALMGPRLRGEKGQFFTPHSLVRAMVEITAPQPHEDVLDPACGTGGFLTEAHAFQRRGVGNGSPTGRLAGVDKDEGLARLAAALLAISSDERADVFSFDSLAERNWDSEGGPLYDVVLTNPPFGSKIGIRSPDILRRFDFGHLWTQAGSSAWKRTGGLLPSQDPQTLFIELCVERLKPGGRLGIVLPEGIFGNKGTAYVWDWLRERGEILALLDCPRTTFQPSTDTKTNVLFFRKGDEGSKAIRRDIRVAVALHCGHDRRGRMQRSDGTPHPDDFSLMAADFHKKKSRHWRTVKAPQPYYLVPRYYVNQEPVDPDEAELLASADCITLGGAVDESLLAIRKGHEPGSDAYGTGDIPFVRTSDITNFEIRVDPTNGVSEEIYEEYALQQQLRPGDVLLVVDGRYRIGASAILTENNCRCIVQSHLRILTLSQDSGWNPYALLYALNLPSVRLRLRNLVFIQSTLGTLGKRLLQLEIPILSGEGPWSEAVARFESSIRERDELLAQLRKVSANGVEL